LRTRTVSRSVRTIDGSRTASPVSVIRSSLTTTETAVPETPTVPAAGGASRQSASAEGA